MFNAKEETKKIIEFIKKYFVDNKLKGAVVGISGGKDSAVVTALMTKALGKENVIGVTMPCESKENDRKDAQLVAKKYDIELINVDLTDTYYTFKKQFSNITKETTTNIKFLKKPFLFIRAPPTLHKSSWQLRLLSHFSAAQNYCLPSPR